VPAYGSVALTLAFDQPCRRRDVEQRTHGSGIEAGTPVTSTSRRRALQSRTRIVEAICHRLASPEGKEHVRAAIQRRLDDIEAGRAQLVRWLRAGTCESCRKPME
jgi:hypothetical protein